LYKEKIADIQTLNEEISDNFRDFLRTKGLNYLHIENRTKSLNSLLEKIFRSVIGSFYDPYKQNRPNDFLAYRIITENNNETLAILIEIDKSVLNNLLPLEFYYKENTPLTLSLEGKNYYVDVVSFDNLNSEHKLLIYRLSNIDKTNYRYFEKIFQERFKQKKAEVEDSNGLTKKAYIVNHPLAREAIFFYDVKKKNLYLILNTSFTVEESYEKFVKLINLIKEKGFESIHKLSLGKEYIGRVPYGLYKIDYQRFFGPLGFDLKSIKSYHLKSLEEELKLEGKGIIGKTEICSYNPYLSFPLVEIQVIDYNTHSFRERNGFYDHKEYEKRRIEKTRKNLEKICEEYRLENKQIEILKN